MADDPTLLLTLVGRDRPGVTAAMFDALAAYQVVVLDVEQLVLRGRLVLGILVTAPPRNSAALCEAARRTAGLLDMELEVLTGLGDTDRRSARRAHVTVLSRRLTPAAVAAIDRIVRMARYPVTAIEFEVSGTRLEQLREVLAREAAEQRVDVAVQSVGLLRHGRRLIVMDVDSTLLQGEAIDLLAARHGVGREVAAITTSAMHGEIDFETSLRRRVWLLEGLEAGVLDEVYDELELAPGARTLVRTLKRLGYRFGIVSGGFTQITDRLAADLGIHYSRANVLEVVDGRLTGGIVGAVVDRAGKAEALRDYAADSHVTLDRTIAIGDGANDLDMLAAAGLGIAFNAKPQVREAADTSVTVPYLDSILYLLGISREDLEADDAAHGIETPRPAVP
jgi:phosphoserine phosphatase